MRPIPFDMDSPVALLVAAFAAIGASVPLLLWTWLQGRDRSGPGGRAEPPVLNDVIVLAPRAGTSPASRSGASRQPLDEDATQPMTHLPSVFATTPFDASTSTAQADFHRHYAATQPMPLDAR